MYTNATLSNGYVYSFYPCGYVPMRTDNTMIWVRYKTAAERAKARPVISGYATEVGAYVDTPDRELYIDRSAHVSDGDRPLRNWDECISLSMLYHVGDDYPNDRFMINHTSFSLKENELGMRSKWLNDIQTNKTVICDSGGFQLRSGKEFWIDPEDLASFYNSFVDEGVTLDIPIPTYNRELLTRMLKVQEKNSKFLMKHVDRNVRIANVAHGIDYADFSFVRERLFEDEEMDILCIPSSHILPDIKSIDRLTYHLTHGMRYRQYHLLGVYNMTWLSLAIKLMVEFNKTQKEPILLTSDASSSIYSASSLRYHKQVMPYKSVSRWPIGLMAPAGGKQNMPSKVLPCSCPICNAVKYIDAINVLGDINIAALLTRHNEIETVQWTKLMCEAAVTMDMKDYLAFCLAQNQSKDKRSITEAFEYLTVFLNEGWEKAHKKFAHRIQTLYNQPKIAREALYEGSRDDGLHENEDVNALNKHLSNVLQRYERFYKTGKKPKLDKGKGKSFHQLISGSNALQSK